MKCGICGANVPYDLDRHKYTQHRDEWVAAKLRRRQNRDAKLKAQHEQVARRQQAIAAVAVPVVSIYLGRLRVVPSNSATPPGEWGHQFYRLPEPAASASAVSTR